MNENEVEKEIVTKGLTAPRLTPEHIDNCINNCIEEDYHVFPKTCVTGFCALTLVNGFTVVGESACVSPENFNAELDKKIARDNVKK